MNVMHRYSIVALAIVVTTTVSAYPGGISGRTLKSTSAGCGSCHGSASSASVVVTISGPDSLRIGESAQYQVDVNHSSGTKGGVNIAASSGSLVPVSTSVKALNGELVHNAPSAVPSTYQFTFTAPANGGNVTLYAIGKGFSMNSWNWAPNKVIKIIVVVPAAPTLFLPAQGVVGQPIDLSLQWSAPIGVTGFELQGSKDSGFTSNAFGDTALTVVSYKPPALALNTTYFWRVRGKNSAGVGPWSEVRNFKTIPHTPDPVALFQPLDQASMSADSAILVWRKPQPEASRYCLQFATDSLLNAAVSDSNITDSTKIVRGLSANVTYWWRVKAWNLAGWGDFSAKRSFSVNTTGVGNSPWTPGKYILDQNFPNPFNPTTTLTFSLPSSTFLSLIIYDVLGKEVAVLARGIRTQGHYSVRWDAAGFPSGVYIYTLTAGPFSKSGKMLLAK